MEPTENGYYVVDITPFTTRGRKTSRIPHRIQQRFESGSRGKSTSNSPSRRSASSVSSGSSRTSSPSKTGFLTDQNSPLVLSPIYNNPPSKSSGLRENNYVASSRDDDRGSNRSNSTRSSSVSICSSLHTPMRTQAQPSSILASEPITIKGKPSHRKSLQMDDNDNENPFIVKENSSRRNSTLRDSAEKYKAAWTTIMAHWRRHKLWLAFARYQLAQIKLKLELSTLPDIPHEKLCEYLLSKTLIQSSMTLIHRIEVWNKNYNPFKDNKKGKAAAATKMSPGRTLLGAFMIIREVTAIPESVRGPIEENVLASARILMTNLESCLQCIPTGKGQMTENSSMKNLELYPNVRGLILNMRINRFLMSWDRYYAAFQGYLKKDREIIVDSLIENFLAAERLWLTVREQIHADTEWSVRISQLQTEIVDKLTKFGQDAINKFELKRSEFLAAMDVTVPENNVGGRQHLTEEPSEMDISTADILGGPSTPSTPLRGTTAQDDSTPNTPISASYSSSIATSPQTFPSALQQSFDDRRKRILNRMESVNSDVSNSSVWNSASNSVVGTPVGRTDMFPSQPTTPIKKASTSSYPTPQTNGTQKTGLNFEKSAFNKDSSIGLSSPSGTPSKGSLLKQKIDESKRTSQGSPVASVNLFNQSSPVEPTAESNESTSTEKTIEQEQEVVLQPEIVSFMHALIVEPDSDNEIAKALEEGPIDFLSDPIVTALHSDIGSKDYDSLPRIVGFIKINLLKSLAFSQQLRSVLGGSTAPTQKFADSIEEVLDIELILQQINFAKNGVSRAEFDADSLAKRICELMLLLCAPVRDSEIRSVAASEGTADAFKRLISLSEFIKRDTTTFVVGVFKKTLSIERCARNEELLFKNLLSTGQIRSTRTRTWLQNAYQRIQGAKNTRNPDGAVHLEYATFKEIFDTAFTDLVFLTECPLSALDAATATADMQTSTGEVFPETLSLDNVVLTKIQNSIHAMTIVVGLLLQVQTGVPFVKDNTALITQLKTNILLSLEDADSEKKDIGLMIIQTIEGIASSQGEEHSSSHKKLTEAQKTFIMSAAGRTVNFQDAVFGLSSRRVKMVLKSHISTGEFKHDRLQSLGLESIAKELEEISNKLVLIAKFNKLAYSSVYDELLSEIVQ